MNLKAWKSKIRKLAEKGIEFDPHFVLKSMQRGIAPIEIHKYLEDPKNLEDVYEHKEGGYRLVFRISSRFQLVIGVQFLQKGLYIKTAFKRYRKWKPKKLKR